MIGWPEPKEAPGGGAFSKLGKLYVPSRFAPSRHARPRTPPPRVQNTAEVTCPRCRKVFMTKRGYTPAICIADTEPFTGPDRGCGWLLKCEPNGLDMKADAVVDVKPITRVRGRPMGDQKKTAWGIARCVENWEGRGVVRVLRNDQGEPIGMEPTQPRPSAPPSNEERMP